MNNFCRLSLFVWTFLFSVSAVAAALKSVPLGMVRLGGEAQAKVDRFVDFRVRSAFARDVIFPEARQTFVDRDDDKILLPPGQPRHWGLWKGEFWGKLMIAACRVAEYDRDEKLKAFLHEEALRLIAHQDADGYLGTYSDKMYVKSIQADVMPTNTAVKGAWCWNIWGRKYTTWGLVSAWKLTGDRRLLDAAVRSMDQELALLKSLGCRMIDTGTFVGMPSCSTLKPLLLLYEETKNDAYLAAAKEIVADWDRDDNRPPNLIRNAFSGKPVAEWYHSPWKWAKAYEMMSCLEGLVEYYRVTGEARILAAVEKIADLLNEHELNPLMTVGYNDQFANAAALPNGVSEPCDTVHWIRLNHDLWRETGKAKYVDRLELAYYNAYLAALRKDGRWAMRVIRSHGYHTETTGNNGMTNQHCCVNNLPRTLADVAETVVAEAADGALAVAFYGDAQVTADFGTLAISGGYPYNDGRIRFAFNLKTPRTVRFRIPAWTAKAYPEATDGWLAVKVPAGLFRCALRFDLAPRRVGAAWTPPVADDWQTEMWTCYGRAPDLIPAMRETRGVTYLRGPVLLAKADKATARWTVEGRPVRDYATAGDGDGALSVWADAWTRDWEDPARLSEGKLPPRAWFGSFPDVESAKLIRPELSPRRLSLDSETDWQFRWRRRPDAVATSDWVTVKVPCSWQAMGIRASGERFGTPIYVNQHFIFTPEFPANSNCWPRVTGNPLPADWTYGPDDNPVGSYRRTFEVPADWIGDRLVLQFDGVESFFYLRVNGTYVGFSKNSRSPAAFDVTRLVKAGKNLVEVEVYRNCDGSYLESQDIYRLSGIIRSVSLTRRPRAHLEDVALTTRPVVAGDYGGDWQLDLRVKTAGVARERVIARVFDANDREILSTAMLDGGGAYVFKSPKLWSAEVPNLYTLVVSIETAKKVVEAAGFQLGFCESTIRDAADQKDRTYLFNGQPIKLKGVNRGECDPLYGHHVPDARLEEDIRLIKQGNFNHIRNSHMPQPAYFYYLCNKYGVYVMDEANLEAHGFFYGKESISHEPSWKAAFLERQESMYEWDKNFPCVVIWSMGNEAGPGDNFKACYRYLKTRDPVRPVQYERNNWLTDMGSRQYPSVQWMWDCAAGKEGLQANPGSKWEDGKPIRYPFHVNEYAHNFNNNCGNLLDYQRAIESSTRIMGGALWDWADQALWMDLDGKRVASWGGCYGEKPENGQGIMDGVVTCDRRPEPGYFEARHVFQPIEVTGDAKGLVVKNKHYFRDTSAYDLVWTLYVDGYETATGALLPEGGALAPQESRAVPLPAAACAALTNAAEEVALRVDAVQRAAEGFWPKDWIIASDQVLLTTRPVGAFPRNAQQRPSQPKLSLSLTELTVLVGDDAYSFSRATGELVRWRSGARELLTAPMTLDCFRAPVGGETHLFIGGEPDFGRLRLMDGVRVMRPEMRKLETEQEADGTIVLHQNLVYFAGPPEDCPSFGHGNAGEIIRLPPKPETQPVTVSAESVWRFAPDGTVGLSTAFKQAGRTVELSRLGWRLVFAVPRTRVDYFACGPYDNYSDRKSACFASRYAAASTEFGFAFGRSQDGGNREEAREVTLSDPGVTFAADGSLFSFAVSPYSPTETIRFAHPELLPLPEKTELGLYAKVRGLGSANCGPAPLDRDRLDPSAVYNLNLKIRNEK